MFTRRLAIAALAALATFPALAQEKVTLQLLHTAHFSIGSGTRLAIEDAITLIKSLEASPNDIGGALAAYEAARKPIVKKLVAAARSSADWYERFGEHMQLDPIDFAFSYITRSGRIDPARLRAMSPAFMGSYERARGAVSAIRAGEQR